MKKLLYLFCFIPLILPAQDSLRLETVIEKATANYPLIRQQKLVEQSRDFTLSALNRAYLPQLSINGQASYQSEVTELPVKINIPGFTIEPPDKDQYKIVADVNQLLYDGGNIGGQKNVQRINARVEQERINVDLQKVRERVRQIYLGILMMDEQIKQVELVSSDLLSGIKKIESAVKNGIAFRSQLSELKAEELKNNQRKAELKSTRASLLKTISLFTGEEYNDGTLLIHPEAVVASMDAYTVQRPELFLFNAQDSLAGAQRKLLGTKSLPKLSLFAQGGYGRPGLNMLKNDFAWFYIAGARLNWNLGALYTLHAEHKVNEITRSSIRVQKDLYLLNANITVEQYRNDISKYNSLLKDDAAIVSLRDEIMQAAKSQLNNGVITSADYLQKVNAADQARQQQLLHRLQLLQVQLDYNDYIAKP